MKKNVKISFLEYLGFEESKELNDKWLQTTRMFGIKNSDLKKAMDEMLPKYWKMETPGVKDMLRAYLMELMDLTRVNENNPDSIKSVYGVVPSISTSYYAVRNAAGESAYVGYPYLIISTVFSSVLFMTNPFIGQAENDAGISCGCKHCGLNKTRIGLNCKSVIRNPDVVWSWGHTCDEAPKTDEFIEANCNSNWKYIVTRLPHDTHFGEKDDEIEDRVEYVAASIKDGIAEIGKIIGVNVKDEYIWQAIKQEKNFMKKIDRLNSLVSMVGRADITGNEISLVSQPIHIPFSTGLEHIELALDKMIGHLESICKIEKEGKKRPKVGCYFVPFSVPWVAKMFEDKGVDLFFSTTLSMTDKQMENIEADNPYKQIATDWLKMPLAVNGLNEVDMICQKIRRYKPDAMVFGLFSFDRWQGAHQKLMVNMVEKETGVPHFYIEGDIWDGKNFNSSNLETRIDSLCDFLKMNKIISEIEI
ncbi:MAG: hypothetical protein C0604_02030 [Clostridiales bacterium]|nr:MAG: hypothetical protein C0604_02030 [Clostridiales bacterium]